MNSSDHIVDGCFLLNHHNLSLFPWERSHCSYAYEKSNVLLQLSVFILVTEVGRLVEDIILFGV